MLRRRKICYKNKLGGIQDGKQRGKTKNEIYGTFILDLSHIYHGSLRKFLFSAPQDSGVDSRIFVDFSSG